MGVPGRTQGTMFTPVPLELIYHEPERVGGKFAIFIHAMHASALFAV